MKNEKLYEILGDISEDYVKEAEEYTNKHRRIKLNKLVLIAAALALLLCGTAATAAGIMWLVPKVQEEENGFSLIYDGGYVELSDETFRTIVDTWGVAGESGEIRLMVIDSFQEWQNFFDIPFVVCDYINYDEKENVSPEDELFFFRKGITVAVMMKEADGVFTPYSLYSGIPVGTVSHNGIHSIGTWSGDIGVYIPLCKEAAKEHKKEFYDKEARTYELIEEGKTPSGIPYVITKSFTEKTGKICTCRGEHDPNVVHNKANIGITLHYGYDSVIYTIGDSVTIWENDTEYPTEEVDALIAKLKELVNTFYIHYPVE